MCPGTKGVPAYLLSRMACSTQEVFSLQDISSECWLIADKNLRISLVLSVLPAPLSPLKEKWQKVFWQLHPKVMGNTSSAVGYLHDYVLLVLCLECTRLSTESGQRSTCPLKTSASHHYTDAQNFPSMFLHLPDICCSEGSRSRRRFQI